MPISLQELRKANEKQRQQEQKQQQGRSANRFPWQTEPAAKKGVLKFAQYLYGS
ncbi:hypothetical protein [Vampirovibrio sp.]|uniref:hypothetical protein n=1 Tax=Vampirovibrio sp. TaxID=2717857 RepID=UPI00359304E2